jgi:hypothetical protein
MKYRNSVAEKNRNGLRLETEFLSQAGKRMPGN